MNKLIKTVVLCKSFIDAERLYEKFINTMAEFENHLIDEVYPDGRMVDLTTNQRVIFVNAKFVRLHPTIRLEGARVWGTELERTLNTYPLLSVMSHRCQRGEKYHGKH